jgi:hypothetical protein
MSDNDKKTLIYNTEHPGRPSPADVVNGLKALTQQTRDTHKVVPFLNGEINDRRSLDTNIISGSIYLPPGTLENGVLNDGDILSTNQGNGMVFDVAYDQRRGVYDIKMVKNMPESGIGHRVNNNLSMHYGPGNW